MQFIVKVENEWEIRWNITEQFRFVDIISVDRNSIYTLCENNQIFILSDRGTAHFEKIYSFHRCVTNIVALKPENNYFIMVMHFNEFFVVCLNTGTLVSKYL